MELNYKYDDRGVRSDAKPFTNDASEPAHTNRERIEEGLESTRKALSEGTDLVQRRAKSAIATGDHYVHEQPWQSIGIAAVVGLLIGFLVGRR